MRSALAGWATENVIAAAKTRKSLREDFMCDNKQQQTCQFVRYCIYLWDRAL